MKKELSKVLIGLLIGLLLMGAILPFGLFIYAAANDHPFARSDVFSDFSIQSRTNIRTGNPEVLYNLDTHGGFHGDGEWLAVLRYQDDSLLQEIEGNPEWNPLPLSDSLKDAEGYFPSLSDREKSGIPDIRSTLQAKRGAYFFLDRHRGSDNTNPKDENRWRNRYSVNFTLAVYDADKKVLVIMETDT